MNGTFADMPKIVQDGNYFVDQAMVLQTKIAEFDSTVQSLKSVWQADSINVLESACNNFKNDLLEPFRQVLELKGQAMVSVGNQFRDQEDQRVEMSSRID